MNHDEHEKQFQNGISLRSQKDLEAAVSSLSPRERQVMDFRLQGLISKQIADELSLSPRTIEEYSASLIRKMGVKTMLGLVILVAGMTVLGYYIPNNAA